MKLFGRRHEMCQLVMACLLCMPLAGQSSTSSTNMTSTAASNKTTEAPAAGKSWFELDDEDRIKVDIITTSVSAVAALLNMGVIIAIVIDPLKKLRSGPWVTILNLATADLISCISAFCFWGAKLFYKAPSKLYRAIFNAGWMLGVSASFLMLTFFAVQIFILTKFPIKSRYCLTTLKSALVCIAVWLLAIVMGFGSLAYLRFGRDSLKIYAGQIGVLQIAVLVQIILNIQVTVEIIRSGRNTGNAHNAKHKNIAKTVIILTLILFFTAFPYFVARQMEFFVRLGYFGKDETGSALYAFSYCYTPISILNFGANPILYSLRLPDYRQTLLAFVGKKRNVGTRRSTTSYTMRSQRTSVTTSYTNEQTM